MCTVSFALNRVSILRHFCPKWGQDFRTSGFQNLSETPVLKHGSGAPRGCEIAGLLHVFILRMHFKIVVENQLVSVQFAHKQIWIKMIGKWLGLGSKTCKEQDTEKNNLGMLVYTSNVRQSYHSSSSTLATCTLSSVNGLMLMTPPAVTWWKPEDGKWFEPRSHVI